MTTARKRNRSSAENMLANLVTMADTIEENTVATFTVDGTASKARPRHGRGRVYTPAATKAAEEAIAWKFRSAAPGHKPDRGPWGLLLVFHGAHGSQDIDNMIKLVMDGLNKIAYSDDRYVTDLVCRKVADESKFTEITVFRSEVG